MRVEDYFADGKRWRLRLNEKGGKVHEMPAHHNLEAYLHEYLNGAGLAADPKAFLFQTHSRATGQLAGNPLLQTTDPTSAINIVLSGSTLPATKTAPSAFTMAPYDWLVSDQDVADVVSFIQPSWAM